MKKEPQVYLAQILHHIFKIEELTRDSKSEFLAQHVIHDAIINNFFDMGHISKQVPEEYRKQYDGISWGIMDEFADTWPVLQEVDCLNPDHVWSVIENFLPVVKSQIQSLFPDLEQRENE